MTNIEYQTEVAKALQGLELALSREAQLQMSALILTLAQCQGRLDSLASTLQSTIDRLPCSAIEMESF